MEIHHAECDGYGDLSIYLKGPSTMSWLVIGIGNTLRRDDGLGPWLAERVADWRLPNVTTRIVHQLTPELAAEIVNHDYILFLDASRSSDEFALIELTRTVGPTQFGHALSPAQLLAWAELLDGGQRRAWITAVPGSDFDFGEGLSVAAERAGERALADIGRLLRESVPCTKLDS